MIRIEVLFPEFCSLFADSSNVRYLKCCLPDAEFVETAYTDEPLFATEKPDLIYMGAMTERAQEMVIQKLMPYKERLSSLIREDVPFLLTGNAMEVFCDHIENEDGSAIPALGLYPFYARRDMMHRFNCLVLGEYMDMKIVGFKTQFTLAYGDTDLNPFIQVKRGTGMNRETINEGIHDHHLFATYLVGPFLVLNPLFVKYLLTEIMGINGAKLAFEDVIMSAYTRRLAEFENPKLSFD